MKPTIRIAAHSLRRASIVPIALTAFVVLSSEHASAQINLALGRPVIDGSGAWQNELFNAGSFPASRAVDGNINEAEGNPESQWLGREGTLNEYFTLDLGTSIAIDRIDLFNTHNRQFNDRGTDEFVIFGSESVDAGNQLINPIPVLTGELTDVSGQIEIIPDSFPLPLPVTARYLQFLALNANNDGNNAGAAERACAAEQWANAERMEVLAIAYAATDRIEEAIRIAGKALALARRNQQTAVAQRIEHRLDQFQRQRPID